MSAVNDADNNRPARNATSTVEAVEPISRASKQVAPTKRSYPSSVVDEHVRETGKVHRRCGATAWLPGLKVQCCSRVGCLLTTPRAWCRQELLGHGSAGDRPWHEIDAYQ